MCARKGEGHGAGVRVLWGQGLWGQGLPGSGPSGVLVFSLLKGPFCVYNTLCFQRPEERLLVFYL